MADLETSDDETNLDTYKCMKNDHVVISLMSDLKRKEKSMP